MLGEDRPRRLEDPSHVDLERLDRIDDERRERPGDPLVAAEDDRLPGRLGDRELTDPARQALAMQLVVGQDRLDGQQAGPVLTRELDPERLCLDRKSVV